MSDEPVQLDPLRVVGEVVDGEVARCGFVFRPPLDDEGVFSQGQLQRDVAGKDEMVLQKGIRSAFRGFFPGPRR